MQPVPLFRKVFVSEQVGKNTEELANPALPSKWLINQMYWCVVDFVDFCLCRPVVCCYAMVLFVTGSARACGQQNIAPEKSSSS